MFTFSIMWAEVSSYSTNLNHAAFLFNSSMVPYHLWVKSRTAKMPARWVPLLLS